MAIALGLVPGDRGRRRLNRLREQHSVEDATLMTPRGRIIAQSGSEPVALLPDLPGPDVLRQVRQQRSWRRSSRSARRASSCA
jgi:hypothetical protein